MESSQKIGLRFQSRPPPPPPGGVIFQDGFESGSSSAWTEVDGEGDLNVTAAAALNGTFGLAAPIDNTTVMYVLDNSPTNEARYRARFYFDPNAITMTIGDLHNIMVALNAGGAAAVARIEFLLGCSSDTEPSMDRSFGE